MLTFGSRPSTALSPEAASTAYDTYASSYDALDGGSAASVLGLDEARSQLFQQAKGKVLEIGAGTGLNLSKYTASVSSLTLVDISQGMLEEAKWRATALKLPFPVHFVKADATSQLVDLFGENSFDTVVDSFSLCVMGNEGAKSCLEQITKAVKAESGSILLLENSRSSNPLLAKYQDITAETAASTGGKGCVYNQDVRALITATQGLTIEKETSYVTGLFRSFICVKHVTPAPNQQLPT
jgi:ubiquinone/menaquinone biosynthesis C-methylase UbiE